MIRLKMALALKINRRRGKPEKVLPRTKSDPPLPRQVSTAERTLKNIETFISEQNLPVSTISSVTMKVFDKETVQKLSVCKVNNINSTADLTNSLEDPRMGTIENYQLCATCEKTNDECTGHLGIMELATNFIHPFFRSRVIQVLSCICPDCNQLILSDNMIKEKGIERLGGVTKLKAMVEASKKLDGCSNPNCRAKPIFKSQKASKNDLNRNVPYFVKEKGKEKEYFMSVDKVKKMLDLISPENAKKLGFISNHPRNFIIDYLPVISFNDRPYNIRDMSKKDHYLTTAYKDILNKNIESLQYEDEDRREECFTTMLDIYDHMIKNRDGEYTRAQNDPVKSITDLVTRKKGLIRGNMMGKRTNYSGRTVIGPNERLNFGWLAVSNEMTNMTVPEIVTPYNYDQIIELGRQGKIKYLCPKAGNLANRKLRFDINKHLDKISYGDKIDRNTYNTDCFIYNRQPTLHRHGMVSFKADFQDKLSTGLHLSSTTGLNADFDGDEGNLHLVQTTEAQVEARLIMCAENCIINLGRSNPEASLVYNSLTGGYLMTLENTTLSKDEFENGINYVMERMKTNYVKDNYENLKEKLDDIDLYTTYGLVSTLFPTDYWYNNKNVIIINGVYKKGIISTAAGGNNGLVQNLYKRYSKFIASDFLSSSNFLFNWYIYRKGFSLGIKDIMITPNDEYKEFLEIREKYINELEDELYSIPELQSDDSFEIEQHEAKILKLREDCASKVNKYFDEKFSERLSTGSIMVMNKSGAKDKKKNTYNVISSLGQILVSNNLPKKTISNNKRWLSTFHTDDLTPSSQGYCKNSYFEGLDPDEYFMQAQDGRISLADTALKTADTGYEQRKMIKAQEDLVSYYDGSVRNQSDMIFQFSYGPGFYTANMIKDNSSGNNIYSFTNLKDISGVINSSGGFNDFSIESGIKNIINEHNKKYNFVIEEYKEEEEKDDMYDYEDDDDDDDFDGED